MEPSRKTFAITTEPQTPPPVYERPSLWGRIREFLNTFWILEILACLFSLVTLATIFIILNHWNSTDVGAWSHSWSLNSEIGLLATLSQIAIAVPLAAGISQLKWVWYKNTRKLSDLDIFDEGSRGPLGSVKLLFSRPFKTLGALGALLTLFTVAFHTLVQNAITTKLGPEQLDNVKLAIDDFMASYPQANIYNVSYDYSTGNVLGDQGPRLDMVGAINYGLYYTVLDPDIQVQLLALGECYTGNCTWPHIQALGVCSQCVDITSDIRSNNGFYTLYDVEMDQDVGLISSEGYVTYPSSSYLQDIGPLISHLAVMARGTPQDEPVGVDCALYWCVLDKVQALMVNFEFIDGEYTVYSNWTNTSSSGQTTYKQTTDIILNPPTCWDEYGNLDKTADCTKTVTPNAQLALQNFFRSSVIGFTGSGAVNTTTNGWDISSEFIQLLFTTVFNTNDVVGAYAQIMRNIAIMMTDNIQQQPQPLAGVSQTYGDTWVFTTLYHIRWGFLIVPALLVVISILFLLATIFTSYGQEKWKTSLLPLLFHPLGEKPTTTPHRMSELKVVAEAKDVRLERGHLGSQFV